MGKVPEKREVSKTRNLNGGLICTNLYFIFLVVIESTGFAVAAFVPKLMSLYNQYILYKYLSIPIFDVHITYIN